MTDAGRAVALYEQVHDSTLNGAPSPIVIERADAAIAALQQELAGAKARILELGIEKDAETYRANAAEASIERLKVCGNCKWHELRHDPYGECEEECGSVGYDAPYPEGFEHDEPWGLTVEPHHHCHWKLSRWAERSQP